MVLHKMDGKPASSSMLANIPRLVSAYFTIHPDMEEVGQQVTFGTSGHRGSALKGSYNEDHILAVTQAICDYRASGKISGPPFSGHRYPRPVRSQFCNGPGSSGPMNC